MLKYLKNMNFFSISLTVKLYLKLLMSNSLNKNETNIIILSTVYKIGT